MCVYRLSDSRHDASNPKPLVAIEPCFYFLFFSVSIQVSVSALFPVSILQFLSEIGWKFTTQLNGWIYAAEVHKCTRRVGHHISHTQCTVRALPCCYKKLKAPVKGCCAMNCVFEEKKVLLNVYILSSLHWFVWLYRCIRPQDF